MLVPVQPSGTKTPLFFVHGVQGVMVLGSSFASVLGPDQPLYIINANGMDGRQPVIDNVEDMIQTYVQEIEGARRTGPVRIAGMCSGCLIAIELARSLQQKGRQTGAVILADPPAVPYSFDRHVHAIDPRQ